MPRLHSANNAETTLAVGISPSDTAFTVTDASVFPNTPFRASINAEIMEVGAINRSTNSFSNVIRGVEGTTAASHTSGTVIQNRFTAGTHEELADEQDVNDLDTRIMAEINEQVATLTRNLTLPSGVIQMYSGDSEPDGWLFCRGQAVSRTTYSNLYSAIGTTFGNGNGTSTFNLPDLRGRVPVGLNSSDSDFDKLNDKGGQKRVVMQPNEMPRHQHFIGNANDRGTAESYTTYFPTLGGTKGYLSNISTDFQGQGDSHYNLQPYIVLNYVIKT